MAKRTANAVTAVAALAFAAIGPVPAQAQELLQGVSVTMRDFARCVVRGDRAASVALLASMPGSDAEATMTKRFTKKYDDCLAMPDSARVSAMLIRGSVAAQLYEQTFGFRAPAGITPQGYGAAWLTGPCAPTGVVAIFFGKVI